MLHGVPLDVERLSARLAEAPPIVLAKLPASREAGVVVEAVVADLCRAHASRALSDTERARFVPSERSRPTLRHLELVLVASWLLDDAAFRGLSTERLVGLLDARLRALAVHALPRAFVEDPERREELVRTALAELGLTPSGESREVADDRLAVLDSVRRHALLQEARAREAEREARRQEIERIRREQEEEARRQAARTTFED